MSGLSERTRAYETLIRHHENGLIGAHHQTITEIMRDGVVFQATINPPQQLASYEGEAGTSLSTILGETVAPALLQLDAANTRIEELTSIGQQLADDCTSLKSSLEAHESALANANSAILELNEQNQSALQLITLASQQSAELQQALINSQVEVAGLKDHIAELQMQLGEALKEPEPTTQPAPQENPEEV